MSLVSWNCQGLGNPWIAQDLCLMVRDKRPNILFLMETKCRKNKMEGIKVKLGYNNMFVVESVGWSGGLALFWQESVDLEIQNFTQRHINTCVKEADGERYWKLTCFYGHPVVAKRHES
jgi:exonuclease III